MTNRSIADRASAAIEAHEIHRAVCRFRRQGLVCSTCTELAERAVRAERILGLDPAAPTEDVLVVADGIVSWSRIAA